MKSIGEKLVDGQNSFVSNLTKTRTLLRDESLDVLRLSLSLEKKVIQVLATKNEFGCRLVNGQVAHASLFCRSRNPLLKLLPTILTTSSN